MESWRKELYHHGIKGQKWGVRRGPPYPLGEGKHPASEKIKKRQRAVHNTVTAVTKARSRFRTTYTLNSIFETELSAPAIMQYAKIAKDLHDDLSSNSGSLNRRNKKKPTQPLKVLSKPDEPSELHQTPMPVTAKFLAKLIPSIAESQKNYTDYNIKNKDGVVIGNFSTNRDSDTEINGVWLGIKSKYEGHGYGQSAMRLAIEDARKQGFKYFTLEVPTNSPNARHIYEKLGFKDTGEAMLGSADDIWGGLTKMRLKL